MLLKRCTHIRMPDGATVPLTEPLRSELVAKILCNDAAIFYEDGQFKHAGEPTEAALKV